MRTAFFFDGGSRPNPGPMEVAVVTGGAAHFRGELGAGDNNEAEWIALLFAVELAVAEGARDVVFLGDSTLVVRQGLGEWPCRSAHLLPYLSAYRVAIEPLERVHLRYVPRSRNLAGIALARRYLP